MLLNVDSAFRVANVRLLDPLSFIKEESGMTGLFYFFSSIGLPALCRSHFLSWNIYQLC